MSGQNGPDPPMIIERDVPITMDDGIVLRADIFRPKDEKPMPVIMTLGPYGKGIHYKGGFRLQWDWMLNEYPDILPHSTKQYMVWETVDPETWVAFGYAVMRVDSRGAGRSEGYLDIFSPRETADYYEAIEWAARQSWSSGKVGLVGISYYAINQWLVASLQPPHLAAMIPWEGAADYYRDWSRHGGILSNAFLEAWYPRQVIRVQHGNADSSAVRDPWIGDLASGPVKLEAAQLQKSRTDPLREQLGRPTDSEWYRERSADWSKVTVPFLSAANWAGFGLHPRGNFEAFTQAASSMKWLECHPGRHEEWFYLETGLRFQKRFLDRFLKGIDNGWDKEPPVREFSPILLEELAKCHKVHLHIRRPFTKDVEYRTAKSWPLPNTSWSKMYLGITSSGAGQLVWSRPTASKSLVFEALSQGVTFISEPLEHETEITGPLAAHLNVSSSTTNMDLFLTFQAFSPEGKEVDFQGTVDPHTPLSQGWLRASHRKLDYARSLPYRPYHSHDEEQQLIPNQPYEVDVELWPTCVVLPKGFTISVRIAGEDFERPAPQDPGEAWTAKGSGPWLHTHPEDRPKDVYGGRTTIYSGSSDGEPSHLLVPIVPAP